MQIDVLNLNGEVTGQVEVSDFVFGIEPNTAVMHQALVRQHANKRLGTHSTKTRGEVSGGGRKPWKQKGTGRARQGSTRAPHWRHGGIVFGPKPRDYTQEMPKRMRRLALRSALSDKARGTIVATGEKQENLTRAASNLPEVKTLLVNYLNLHDLLKNARLVLDREALAFIERTWGEESEERLRMVRRAA
jgi:large subunit ribosomal protein L4